MKQKPCLNLTDMGTITQSTEAAPAMEDSPESNLNDIPDLPESEESSEDETEESGRPLRLRRRPAWFGDYVSR